MFSRRRRFEADHEIHRHARPFRFPRQLAGFLARLHALEHVDDLLLGVLALFHLKAPFPSSVFLSFSVMNGRVFGGQVNSETPSTQRSTGVDFPRRSTSK